MHYLQDLIWHNNQTEWKNWAKKKKDCQTRTSTLIVNASLLTPKFYAGYSNSLRAWQSEDQIPVRVRFSAFDQTGPGAHPASCTMGTGSFPGVKQQARGASHPTPFITEANKRVQLPLYSSLGFRYV
jgi:hypothetical protein